MTHPADDQQRDLLVQAYLDGDADEAGRALVEADDDLLADVRAHEQIRAELRRIEPVADARRDRVLAAALSAFEETRALAAPVAPPPPVSLAARRHGRWLVPAAAAVAAVIGGAVVATVVSDSDSEQTSEQSLAADAPAGIDSTLSADAPLLAQDEATDAAERAPSAELVEDVADAEMATAAATGTGTSLDSAEGGGVPPALPRFSTPVELGELAATVIAGDDTSAAAATATSAGPVAASETTAITQRCADDAIARAELVDGQIVREVDVRIDELTGEIVALDAETCDEVMRAPMP